MKIKQALRFTGKISWEGRANGLPEYIHSFVIFADFDSVDIGKLIEHEAGRHVHNDGMYVESDQGAMIDLSQKPQDRMYVNNKWIVWIKPDIITFNPELSLPDENGVERISDGSEPSIQ